MASTLQLGEVNGSLLSVRDANGVEIGNVTIGDDPGHDVNTLFLLLSAYLVFFMQAGFAFLSAGSVRAKNAKTIILKNLLDSCFGAVCFYTLGFAFAYGGTYDDGASGNRFIGYKHFALTDLPADQYAYWFFQYAFAAAASSIVSGAVEERMQFTAYLGYAVYLTSFVYPVVAHWVWSNTGWLSAFRSGPLLDTGMFDFAGCGVVHMVGGFTGLVGATILGPRIGRFGPDGQANAMPGHSASLCVLGVFLLWFGWYGFNPGSALVVVNSSDVAALAAVNTTMSAACGTISAMVVLMLIEYSSTGLVMWDLIGAGNGCLAGLVAITANCAFVETWAAVFIGTVAGALYCGVSVFVLNVLKVDDPLDAVAVHAANGVWGLLAASAFASEDGVRRVYGETFQNSAPHGYGFLMGGNASLLGCAVIGILSIAAWTVLTMVPFFLGLRTLGWLRVPEHEEIQGLDISHHGGSAYQGDEYETHIVGDGSAKAAPAGLKSAGLGMLADDKGSQKGGQLGGVGGAGSQHGASAGLNIRLRVLEDQNTLLLGRLVALENSTMRGGPLVTTGRAHAQ